MTPPPMEPKPKASPVPRLFLAMMLVCAGISGMFLPPGDPGPISQLAVHFAQEWHDTIAHTTQLVR